MDGEYGDMSLYICLSLHDALRYVVSACSSRPCFDLDLYELYDSNEVVVLIRSHSCLRCRLFPG